MSAFSAQLLSPGAPSAPRASLVTISTRLGKAVTPTPSDLGSATFHTFEFSSIDSPVFLTPTNRPDQGFEKPSCHLLLVCRMSVFQPVIVRGGGGDFVCIWQC